MEINLYVGWGIRFQSPLEQGQCRFLREDRFRVLWNVSIELKIDIVFTKIFVDFSKNFLESISLTKIDHIDVHTRPFLSAGMKS